MSSYVSADLRRLVASRAGGLCEYCLIHEDDTYLGCQVDHVISEKHGGPTESENLAYACALCNRAKGSDIGSIASSTGALTRLIHGAGGTYARCAILTRSASEGNSFCRPRLRFGLVWSHE